MNDISNIVNPITVQRALGKVSFYDFLKIVWSEISGEPYVDGWHIKLLCDYLQATYERKVRNLLINIPSRHAKSTIMSVFPAWVWINKPNKTFLYSSYSEGIAIDSIKRCRNLVISDLYQQRWPLRMPTLQEAYIENERHGFVRAVGAGGSITGRGGDWLICDDPINSEEINSESIRKSRNLWYRNTWSNRHRDPKTVVKILIQQRLSLDDTTQMILDLGLAYEHICLPAEYDGKRYFSTIGLDDPRTEIGEILWENRYGKAEIEEIKQDYTEAGYSAQFQMRPSPLMGNIFKFEWLDERIENSDIFLRFIYCDTSSSVKATADFNGIIVGEIRSDYRLFIRHVSKKRLAFPDLQAEVEQIATKYKHKLKAIIIESKANGISLQQSISKTSPDWMRNLVMPFNHQGDKIQLFQQAALWCEKGCVLFPPPSESYPWLAETLEEITNVPNTAHDDVADAFSSLIISLENYLERGLRLRSKRSV